MDLGPHHPLDPAAFAALWEYVNPPPMTSGGVEGLRHLASTLPVFLGQATLWAWHRDTCVFSCLSMPTSDGLRWAMPGGRVAADEAEVLSAMRLTLGPGAVECVQANTLDALKSQLPACLAHGHWNRDGFQGVLGAGLLLEACDPAQSLDGDAIVSTLAQFSCHPHFGQRIVADLRAHGCRSTTVMAPLIKQLPEIARALAPLGVRVSRTWARPGAGNSDLPAGVDPSYSAYLRPKGP